MEKDAQHHPVGIVGGGLSGLAAAVTLSSSGIPVLVVEQRPTLGGRASSYEDATTGDTFDNGQHLLIAGYRRTMALLDRIGSRHLVHVQDRPVLPFHHPTKGFVEFRLPKLPAPLNLLWGVLTSSLFSPADRLPILAAGRTILRHDDAPGKVPGTIDDWLRATRQTDHARRCFWSPLAVAIMNEKIERAPAATFLRALRKAFLGDWHNGALVTPRVGLSRLFAEPAKTFIEDHGGRVVCSTDVKRVIMEDGAASGVLLRTGDRLACRSVILAVPPGAIPGLLPVDMVPPPGLNEIQDGPVSPIVSLHLWFHRPFMDHDLLGLLERRIHWIFRKERFVSAVISAAYDTVELSNEALVRLTVEDLRSVYGEKVGEPYHAIVIREKRATIALHPGNEDARPGARTSVENLFLAGDWTNTGLPATIEGAVQSGEEAAGLVAVELFGRTATAGCYRAGGSSRAR